MLFLPEETWVVCYGSWSAQVYLAVKGIQTAECKPHTLWPQRTAMVTSRDLRILAVRQNGT